MVEGFGVAIDTYGDKGFKTPGLCRPSVEDDLAFSVDLQGNVLIDIWG